MPEILTESFCERCGTRYTFESASPRGPRLKGLKVMSRGLKNFVLSDDTSMDEAMAAARNETDRQQTAQQLDAFHKTFNFCMSCRQYTCGNCWNEAEGRCLSCAPHLGHEILPAPFSNIGAGGAIALTDNEAIGLNDRNGHDQPAEAPAPAEPMAWPEPEPMAWPTSDLMREQELAGDGPSSFLEAIDAAARLEAVSGPVEAAPIDDVAAEAQDEAPVAAQADVELPTTAPATDAASTDQAAAAAANTTDLLSRFRPGEDIEEELAAYERAQAAAAGAAMAAAAEAAVAQAEAEEAAAARARADEVAAAQAQAQQAAEAAAERARAEQAAATAAAQVRAQEAAEAAATQARADEAAAAQARAEEEAAAQMRAQEEAEAAAAHAKAQEAAAAAAFEARAREAAEAEAAQAMAQQAAEAAAAQARAEEAAAAQARVDEEAAAIAAAAAGSRRRCRGRSTRRPRVPADVADRRPRSADLGSGPRIEPASAERAARYDRGHRRTTVARAAGVAAPVVGGRSPVPWASGRSERRHGSALGRIGTRGRHRRTRGEPEGHGRRATVRQLRVVTLRQCQVLPALRGQAGLTPPRQILPPRSPSRPGPAPRRLRRAGSGTRTTAMRAR